MKRALLVIDVQNEYFDGALPVTHPHGSLEHILTALGAARKAQSPVVVVQHSASSPESRTFRPGTPGWELHPSVAAFPRDLLLEKHLPGSFTNTELDSWLRERQISTVTIAGYMTQMCCDTTSRQAFHRGFHVEFLSDATGTLAFDTSAGSVTAEELHRAILVTQALRFAEVLSTDAWIARLQSGA